MPASHRVVLTNGSRILVLQSFALKNFPQHSKHLFDCCVLKNPWKVEALKVLPGTSIECIEFVKTSSHFGTLFRKVLSELNFQCGKVWNEPKHFDFFCYGGKHRSVAMVEIVADYLIKKMDWKIMSENK